MVYLDNLLFMGEQKEIDILFNKTMQYVLFRSTGKLITGKTINLLRRIITYKGDYININLENNYIDNILKLKEFNMTTYNVTSAPGFHIPKLQ